MGTEIDLLINKQTKKILGQGIDKQTNNIRTRRTPDLQMLVKVMTCQYC
jgi:hypothetical protein